MNDNSSNKKKNGFFTAAGLMLISGFLFWLCDIGIVPALCMGSAALCFLGAGLNQKNKETDEDKAGNS